MSAADLLTQCEAAISAVLGGQEYYIGDRRLRRADLSELRIMRRELQDEVAAGSSGGSMASLGQVDKPNQAGFSNIPWSRNCG